MNHLLMLSAAIGEDALNVLSDYSHAKDAANPDSRLHPSIMDGVVTDAGDFYEGEIGSEEGRNEHNAKRAAESEGEAESKKPRLE